MSISYDTRPSNYQICSLLGECTTKIGAVYSARHLSSNTVVALKKYNLEKITREDTALIQEEIILMRQLCHPNVLPCLTAFVSGHTIVAVTPLMGYGSCHDIMMRHFSAGLPEPAIACILRAVITALGYLHSKAIIHRAVRASHILISTDGNVVLTGLRYSCRLLSEGGRWLRKVHMFPPSTLPNLNWLSPELLQQNLEGYSEKCDVYSFGVMGCELANGIVPFWDTPTTFMLTEKMRGASPQLIDCTTFVHSANQGYITEDDYMRAVSERKFSENFHSLCETCMEREAVKRPRPHQLLSHPFLKGAPHSSALPSLLLPAIPIVDSGVLEVQGTFYYY
ncbi:hypothetical protein AAG570_010619 [Ranatra chinensis]|uniref:Protein kinase domain-containing protein n=1 Tax=Ranatra chinensis TaxID=642074 RepID=A0ABD0Z163_9HEMI